MDIFRTDTVKNTAITSHQKCSTSWNIKNQHGSPARHPRLGYPRDTLKNLWGHGLQFATCPLTARCMRRLHRCHLKADNKEIEQLPAKLSQMALNPSSVRENNMKSPHFFLLFLFCFVNFLLAMLLNEYILLPWYSMETYSHMFKQQNDEFYNSIVIWWRRVWFRKRSYYISR